ncbi:Tetratricopeptide repeat protein 39B [Desmophyllum pertusum]|uniref:Tetratricopeptide repeat protein 39B n=1 Tax=Desmophyllum pertusum TaxID=174260 RepID=A0A9W9ZLT1_9CNID|nr:Tetratricopeptide repeat protein 39B [Desmophyllum pertusum]
MARIANQEIAKEDDKGEKDTEEYLFRSKDLVQDFYWAPFACAEVGFLHLEEGDLDQAKEFLNKARYRKTLSCLCVVDFKDFMKTFALCETFGDKTELINVIQSIFDLFFSLYR